MSPPTSSGRSIDRSDLRRAPAACQRCRRRKTKCMGGHPCQACALAGLDCIYFKAPKRVLVAEDYLHQLEARLDSYQKKPAGRSLEPEPSSSPPDNLDFTSPETTQVQVQQTPPSTSKSDACDVDDNPFPESTVQLLNSAGGEMHYLGATSSLSLGLRFCDFIGTLRNSLDNRLGVDPSIETAMAHSPARRKPIEAGQNLMALPPVTLARRLFNTQFAYFGTTFCLTDRTKFDEDVRRIHAKQLDLNRQDDCLDYCQVLIILAFGQMYSINQWTSDSGPPGYGYFQNAMELLPDIHGQGSLTFIKVLALTAWFLQNLNRRDAAFLYIGLAIRMSVTLGLHQEVSDQLYDATTREHRRRLWWSVYSMDRILCIKFGNPPMISDEDIYVLPPSSLETESDHESPAIALRHYTELSKTLGKILKTVYQRGQSPETNLITSVQSILADLSSWDAGLPQHLRFNFDNRDQAISRAAVSMYLHYSQCINMAARPLVFQIVRKRLRGQKDNDSSDWTTELAPAAVSIVNACVAAARNTAHVMARAAQQNWIATYGYQDAEHAFSAALILVMVNIALPFQSDDRKAMSTAMDIMEGMADKGSDHVRYLHNLLLGLCTAGGLLPPDQPSTETSTQVQGPEIPPPASDLANIIPNFDLDTEVGQFQGDQDMMTDLNVTNDPNFWWDGYGILDMNRI